MRIAVVFNVGVTGIGVFDFSLSHTVCVCVLCCVVLCVSVRNSLF